jgi:hypothetical protein
MYKRKSGGASWNGPDAADKMNNSIVIYNLKVLCLCWPVEEMMDHQPVQAQTQLIHIQPQASTNTDSVQPASANTNTDPVLAASASTNTDAGEVQAASDSSISDPNRTVSAPPNEPAYWPPVLTDFMRTELVRRGPFKPGPDFLTLKTSLEQVSIQSYYRDSCQMGKR